MTGSTEIVPNASQVGGPIRSPANDFEDNRHSRKRWFSLTFLLVAGLLSSALLQPLYTLAAAGIAAVLTPWPRCLQDALVVFMVAAVWVVVIRLKGFRIVDLSCPEAALYPPAWMAGLAGAVLYGWLINTFADALGNEWLRFDRNVVLEFTILVAIAIFVAASVNGQLWLEDPEGSHGEAPSKADGEDFSLISKNPQLLLKWISEECPIQSPSEDRFGMKIIAERVANILAAARLHTIGVVGP